MTDSTHCPECGGRLNRPGLFGCDRSNHPAPTPAQQAVRLIEHDLTDRRGLKQEFARIDEETQYEIREAWAAIVDRIISQELTRAGRQQP